jgi:hypothetical protein
MASPAACPGPRSRTAPRRKSSTCCDAWLVEDLPGGRVRILTQETQIGRPAAALADERPNPMLNGHQAWLDGLISAARG